CNGHRTIAVGAYDSRHERRPLLSFSSVGPTRDGRGKPDISAPGGGILAARSSSFKDGVRTQDLLAIKSGTSMASPHVSGAIALMFDAAGHERLSIDETRQILFSSARPVESVNTEVARHFGAGRLNAAGAVHAVRASVAQRGEPRLTEVRIPSFTTTTRIGRIPTVEQLLTAVGVHDVPKTTYQPPRRQDVLTLPLTRPLTRRPTRAVEEMSMNIEMVETESVLEWLEGSPEIEFDQENAENCLDWLTGSAP